MEQPRNKVLFICTGCQGESRAALSKIARNEHPGIRLSPGDTIIFSSRTIPGNETNISYMVNKLVLMGLEVITDKEGFIHVSGHPARGELERMYKLVRPTISVPVHGEARHIHEHAEYAKELGIGTAIEPSNGVIINLTAVKPGIIGRVESGYLGLDGISLIDTNAPVIRTRRKIRDDGCVLVSIAMNKQGQLMGTPLISAPGCLDPNEDTELFKELREAVVDAIAKPTKRGGNSKQFEESIRNAVRTIIRDALGKKPVLELLVHQL